ncbi:MAG: 2-C-methyl-D-erythritol 4-phosphate cytidylyltransferase [Bacteroidota bacterium]
MNGYALIVAGGSGQRMKSDLPKQFLLLKGVPILIHTLRKFDANFRIGEICLVLPESHFKYWEDLSQSFSFRNKITIVAGGKTRFDSVKNGLEVFQGKKGLVAIHDAVRPIISNEVIDHSFEKANEKGSAIVAVDPKDSVREVEVNGRSHALDRSKLKLIQTPQTFNLEWITEAYNVEFSSIFTDDASVYENSGRTVELIEGDYNNIKITTPEDLKIAESLM